MRKKSTRLLSAALAACMMLSVLPVGAFAAEPGTEPENGNGVSAQADAAVPEGYIAINEKKLSGQKVLETMWREESGIKITTTDFSPSEIAESTWISCDNREIDSLEGIQVFYGNLVARVLL